MFGVDSRGNELPTPWHYPLSEREAEIAELIAAGLTNVEIAAHFGREPAHDQRAGLLHHDEAERRETADIAAWVAQHRPG